MIVPIVGDKWAAKHPASATALAAGQLVMAGIGMFAVLGAAKAAWTASGSAAQLSVADAFEQQRKLRDRLDEDREKRIEKENKRAKKDAEEKADKKARKEAAVKRRQEYDALPADQRALVDKFGGTPSNN